MYPFDEGPVDFIVKLPKGEAGSRSPSNRTSTAPARPPPTHSTGRRFRPASNGMEPSLRRRTSGDFTPDSTPAAKRMMTSSPATATLIDRGPSGWVPALEPENLSSSFGDEGLGLSSAVDTISSSQSESLGAETAYAYEGTEAGKSGIEQALGLLDELASELDIDL